MSRFRTATALTLAALVAAPAAADRVVTIKSHTDAIAMMGQKTPATDETHKYWFGDDAVRYDAGDLSTVVRFDQKKLFWINHPEKQYSSIDLPIDFKKLVPPEMAPMMEQMAGMMSASAQVSETGKTGSYGGFDCTFYKVDISMAMMSTSMNTCVTKKLPIDYSRYQELVASQSEMFPNMKWMKELAKLEGFPVRSESTTTMMGKSFGSWQEIVSSEEVSAPAGTYGPPAGYREQPFNPMAGAGRNR